MRNILTMILAGGRGERLYPLTEDRAKPAVPFGGKYRIIDFTLSNCINSGLRNMIVLIQYKSHSLDRHIRRGWNVFNPEVGEYIFSLPPQQRISQDWYRGTADAVYQNWFIVEDKQTEFLLILAGDHVYKMNYREMHSFLQQKQADVVVGAIEYPLAEASSFGVMTVDGNARITRWDEKPAHPTAMPSDPTRALCSMGIYLFRTSVLHDDLFADAARDTSHDFGKDIIPGMIADRRVFAYNFRDENRKAVKYWRDVGTLDAYWEANMDLVSVDPLFNLYDQDWPIRTYQGQFPPAKFVFAEEFDGGRAGIALDSIVSSGCVIAGGRVQNSVLSAAVRVNDHAEVLQSIVMENVVVGDHCRIRRAIIDKGVIIPPKTEIGYDLEADHRRFTVTESGIVAISKGVKLDGGKQTP
ncbi:MAG TPA: glucose-1-phosphate adenylyltransferase [Nitrospirales bacterium]